MTRARGRRRPQATRDAKGKEPRPHNASRAPDAQPERGDVLARRLEWWLSPPASLPPVLGWLMRGKDVLAFPAQLPRAVIQAGGGEPREDRRGRVPSGNARAVCGPRRRPRHAEAAREMPGRPHPAHPVMGARNRRDTAGRRRPQGRVRGVREMSRGLRRHAAASPKMKLAAGIAVMISSFCAVAGDGLQMRRRRRDTWTRLTPSFSARASSETSFASIHV